MKCKQHPEVAKKKYCYDCKYRPMCCSAMSCWYDSNAKHCGKILKEKHTDTPHAHEVEHVYAQPQKDNKKNNCPYFIQRRWWE